MARIRIKGLTKERRWQTVFDFEAGVSITNDGTIIINAPKLICDKLKV